MGIILGWGVTASKVHDVLTCRDRTDPKNLICKTLGYGGHFNTPCTQWGLDTETDALAVYETTVKPYHTEVKLKRTVLVNERCPYIGSSPDSVQSCGCHNDILIEVKCPFSLRGQDPIT